MLENCQNYTRYPENIVIKKGECYLGPLNSFAFILAEEVLTDFCVAEEFEDIRKAIEKSFCPLIKDKKFDFSKLSIASTEISGTKSRSYVGVFCSEIYEEKDGAEKPVSWWGDNKDDRGQKVVIALANTTPEYTEHFEDISDYIKDKNIARGNEIIMLERRSWIIASTRLRSDKEQESTRFRIGIVECLLYCLEAIIATTLAIETFNEDLEEIIKPTSHHFNINISENIVEGNFDGRQLKEFIEIISRARSISPCEDIITSIEAHLKSSTSVRAIASMRDVLELDSLISLARERMRNYSYFLQTGHHIVESEEQREISKKLEEETTWIKYFTVIVTILTAIMLIFQIIKK